MLPVVHPGAIGGDVHQAVEADLARADRHAACFHGHTFGEGIRAFNPRITGDAFLAGARCAAIHRLLVRALLNALAVTAAARLVDQHDAILGALIDRLARAGRSASRVSAVVADALQIEEPGLGLGEWGAFRADTQLISFVGCGSILVKIWGAPLGI